MTSLLDTSASSQASSQDSTHPLLRQKPNAVKVSDMIGRRPVVLGGLALYLVGGAACALAPSYEFLLGARFV